MTSIIIGILSGLLIILLIGIFKLLDKKVIYGLILSGIGFLYVGFVWTDSQALVVNAIQAILFLFLAYYGIKRSIYILATGYFLHGCWDIAYHLIASPGLVPPHYDLFCFSIDFTIGFYILVFKKRFTAKKSFHK
ncbi:MAG: DUF6010 family protein [Xanthomarina sp.]